MTTEREFFTNRRKELLLKMPDLAKVEHLGKYCYIPLDIPRIENPDFANWFFERSKPIVKQFPDIAGESVGGSLFDAIDVFPGGDNFDYDKIWTINPHNDFLTLFPDIYNKILEYFPFNYVNRIRFFSSSRDVLFHRDHSKFVDFPGAFRIVMHDENPEPTLNLVDSPFVKSDRKVFNIHRLESTNSFVWNNLRTKHGSRFTPGRRKILAILDYWDFNLDKYIDLMNRSISKYQEYAMTSNHTITDYLDI